MRFYRSRVLGSKLCRNLLDAGVHRAARGQMTLLVVGEEAVFETHHPLLEKMSGQIVYKGEAHSGHGLDELTPIQATIGYLILQFLDFVIWHLSLLKN